LGKCGGQRGPESGPGRRGSVTHTCVFR
jgi:hypothetical protein